MNWNEFLYFVPFFSISKEEQNVILRSKGVHVQGYTRNQTRKFENPLKQKYHKQNDDQNLWNIQIAIVLLTM